MTNAVIQKRLSRLEAEVRLIKRAVSKRRDFSADEKIWNEFKPIIKAIRAQRISGAPKKGKRLPKWLQASLKDIEEGRVYGPFDTVEELRTSLEAKGS